ncbi:MAG: methyltransferase [Mycobacteriaceae bacterium]|nr:methyltransferase [Mycobacteriaceae bacterium]
MMILRAPGVYRPQADTALLLKALAGAAPPPGGRVLDAFAGTGVLAVAALGSGAASAVAVDVSRRALVSTWLNARLRRHRIELVHGDATELAAADGFDLVLANPPYVPAPAVARGGAARAWDAGPAGRAVLDPLCSALPQLLRRNGIALIVHSALCEVDRSLRLLREHNLKAAVVARSTTEFGPVMRARAAWLRDRGLIANGQHEEGLVVIRADRTES